LRALARDFSATTRDAHDNRWELRLLSQPLFRYESTDPEVVDGALFAYVTSAGTDPEALLVIEARRHSKDGIPTWYRALARFTDLNLSVRYKGTEVFSASTTGGNTLRMYPNQQYRLFTDRIIPDGPAASTGGGKE
jgi:hypothetical protein